MNTRLICVAFVGIGMLMPSLAHAQAPTDRAWFNVDAAQFQSHQKQHTFTHVVTISQEFGGAAAAYPELGDNADLDVSGGVQFGHGIGVGVHFDMQKYESTVGMAISIPSPYFFNLSATDARPTSSTLERRERALDIGAVYSVPTPRSLSVRVFGGPTFFSVKNEMVDVIRYDQIASSLLRVNVVTIRTFETQDVKESAIGFHVGGDVGWFFSRHVGVGGGVRLNRGEIDITEPLSGDDEELQVGHVAAGAGLRLRF